MDTLSETETDWISSSEQRSLHLHEACLGFGRDVVLRSVSGSIVGGRPLGVTGPNGAGKSTFITALAGLLEPRSGIIRQGGLPPGPPNKFLVGTGFRARRPRIAYLPQQITANPTFPITVREFLKQGLWRGMFGLLPKDTPDRLDKMLSQLTLHDLGSSPIRALSGGQFRRLCLGRLLLTDADAYLLDEPFASLDRNIIPTLTDDLLALAARGRIVVVASHNLTWLQAHLPDTLLLAGRVVAWGPSKESLSDTNLAQAHLLLRSSEMPTTHLPAGGQLPLCDGEWPNSLLRPTTHQVPKHHRNVA